MDSKNPFSHIKCRSITILNHIIKDSKVIYTIEIKLSNNQSILVSERYSELLNLHNLMCKESKEVKLPPFPPKKFFGNTDELFLKQRQTNLNNYYNIITSSDIFVNLPSFKMWLQNKFSNIKIKKKENSEFYFMNDIDSEINRQKKIEKEINLNIIPSFIDMTEEWDKDKDFSRKKREKKYYNVIKSEIFPFVENSPFSNSIEGNNANFNFIGSKKNNLLKIEKLFNAKLIDINKNINSECFEKYKAPDLYFKFDL